MSEASRELTDNVPLPVTEPAAALGLDSAFGLSAGRPGGVTNGGATAVGAGDDVGSNGLKSGAVATVGAIGSSAWTGSGFAAGTVLLVFAASEALGAASRGRLLITRTAAIPTLN